MENLKLAKKLIKNGCDPNFETDNISAFSPLYVAAQNDDFSMLRFLIDEGGAKINDDMAAYFSIMGYYSAGIYLRQKLDEEKENKK